MCNTILYNIIQCVLSVLEQYVLKDAILISAIGHSRTGLGWSTGHLMMRMTHVAGSPRRCQVFEHALRVLRQHLAEIARHWIGPEEIMI